MRFLELFVTYLFEILMYAIVARALLSWFVPPTNRLALFLDELTGPVVNPIRHFMPRTGGIDFSPLVALILLKVAQSFLLGAIR